MTRPIHYEAYTRATGTLVAEFDATRVILSANAAAAYMYDTLLMVLFDVKIKECGTNA